MMGSVLTNLQNRNNILKSKLVHEQLKYGNYTFYSYKKEMSQVLNEYRKHNSIFKSSLILGLNPNMVMKWYVQGQKGNQRFRSFYLRINYINKRIRGEVSPQIDENVQEPVKDYEISNYGDSWVYTTYVDDEKISIISGDLDNLKNKVNSRNLPLYE